MPGLISVGKNTKVVGPIKCFGSLSIGDNCWGGREFSIEGNGSAKINDNVDIGPKVSFYTGTHEIGERSRRAGRGYNGKISVGEGCWICGSVKILPDVQIGNGSVIANGSVVCKNIPEDVLAGGVPSKVIKDLA